MSSEPPLRRDPGSVARAVVAPPSGGLGLRVIAETGASPAEVPPLYLATSEPIEWKDGFYQEEWDGQEDFRWMSRAGRIAFAAAPHPRFLEISVHSEFLDLSQVLTAVGIGTSGAGGAGEQSASFDLTAGWMVLSIPVDSGLDELALEVNKSFPPAYYSGDDRELAVRLRAARLHADPERHRHVARQHPNAQRNTLEMRARKTELDSTPPSLGIDLHGACNVNPPCVYCEWDQSKDLEGDYVGAPFTSETLDEYGEFFDNASYLVNCSIGEPFMMKSLDDLLSTFGRQGKRLEMTTNGQILTDRNINRLLGRSVDLYISLDAATAETYAKLRNDKWDLLIANLRRLIAAKGATKGLPRIHLVFMPMRANLHELGDFVRLCGELQPDSLVLRPLNTGDSIDLVWDRAGYRYDYQQELLPFDELVRASAETARLCREKGVRLNDQMDFGGSSSFVDEFTDVEPTQSTETEDTATETPEIEQPVADPDLASAIAQTELPETPVVEAADTQPLPSLGAEGQPLCAEPWKSLYILRRGVMPCCYGGQPIAPMDEYRQTWNSPILQEIRRDLAAGRFHAYCLDSPSCPVVRKAEEGHRLPLGQRIFMRSREGWHRFAAATETGWKARAAWPFKVVIGLGLRVARSRSKLYQLRASTKQN